MTELFRLEVEEHTRVLVDGLLALEHGPAASSLLQTLMRAAHSLKGAARIVGRAAAVRLAHAMEECFVAGQRSGAAPDRAHIDACLKAVDLFAEMAALPDDRVGDWESQRGPSIDTLCGVLSAVAVTPPAAETATPVGSAAETPGPHDESESWRPGMPDRRSPAVADRRESARVLRVNAETLERLMDLAGESMIASRWLSGFAADLVRVKRLQQGIGRALAELGGLATDSPLGAAPQMQALLLEAQHKSADCVQHLGERTAAIEQFDRSLVALAERLYRETLHCRMRPFGDCVQPFGRLVRDVAQDLERDAVLEIAGEHTPVDREVMERLEAPLGHLLRNAVDHGIEPSEDRARAGKPARASIRLAATHAGGMLVVSVSDDGRGIDREAVRRAVSARGLAPAEIVDRCTDDELLEFLFLPGFSLRESVTVVSGRGVGLDVVQATIKSMNGTIRVQSEPGRGTTFQLRLPLTLSVVRTLLVDVAGEPYALPLARVAGVTTRTPADIASMGGRQHFAHNGRTIGLVTAHQLFGVAPPPVSESLAIVIVEDGDRPYGVMVDRFLGERELVLRPLDRRFGKIKDIAAAATMPDGAPALVVDMDDLVRSIQQIVTHGEVAGVESDESRATSSRRKRVLVVDDSLTVRELERKLLEHAGYEVQVATDGIEGWNAVRSGHFDLVITDVDMPRMDGIALVSKVRQDPRLAALPVMILSYKDRDEDRRRGVEAGADYYLTKGSFHDDTLVGAVADLIGRAAER